MQSASICSGSSLLRLLARILRTSILHLCLAGEPPYLKWGAIHHAD